MALSFADTPNMCSNSQRQREKTIACSLLGRGPRLASHPSKHHATPPNIIQTSWRGRVHLVVVFETPLILRIPFKSSLLPSLQALCLGCGLITVGFSAVEILRFLAGF